MSHVHYLLMYLLQLLHHFYSTMCWELTSTYGPACNIARSFAYITSQLLSPICPLLGHTPSIQGGIISDANIPGDVKSSIFHSLHHSWLVLPLVEVGLHNTYLVRTLKTGCTHIEAGKSSFMAFVPIS